MIKITPYTDKYKDDVMSLILNVYEKELNFTGYKRPDILNISEVYQKNLASNFWIALNDGELIGTVGVLAKTKNLAYLKRMIVKKEFRKQGLGKMLLDTAITFARKHSFKTLYAGTIKENPKAIEFYKHYNFVECDDVPEDITAAKNSICLKLDL